jgi:beta-glucosidase/6-phospho-beta-glucosidase/beta-galactosidase
MRRAGARIVKQHSSRTESTIVSSLHDVEPIEVWGGVECTCNRVKDHYFDQMDLSGHTQRLSDFDRFAELGIRTLRVGILWEHSERDGFWSRTDAVLQRLKELRIRPIAGLLHHGSGPADTNLLDPEFPGKLAAYALRVAERYPWIDAYTPVNEPNTTARFSGLYGVWYPHHRSRRSYLRALLGQLKGTVLSMLGIRSVRSDAQLIQTEDVGNITGTPELRNVWEQLNQRQWLPFDLLCGRVDRQHPLFAYMRSEGLAEDEIFWFAENRCAPDVLGINYYATSDRYIDHRVHLYPENTRSAEGRFVDIEAVRVSPTGIVGVDALILAAWNRYRISLAITEVHLGSSVDEQIRWVAESWRAVANARRAGVQCIGITAWALLGSFYWNELVTRANGYYEAGLFDVRSGVPVPTELAGFVRRLANGEDPAHAALNRRGWWHNPDRITYPSRGDLAA